MNLARALTTAADRTVSTADIRTLFTTAVEGKGTGLVSTNDLRATWAKPRHTKPGEAAFAVVCLSLWRCPPEAGRMIAWWIRRENPGYMFFQPAEAVQIDTGDACFWEARVMEFSADLKWVG